MDQNLRVADIDFLPAAYREQGAKRNSGLWQLLMAATFGVLLATISWNQRSFRVAAEEELLQIQSTYSAAEAQNARVGQLQAQLAPLSVHAELLTYLRHPWSRANILATIARELPDDVTLSEIQISREKIQVAAAPPNPAATAAQGTAPKLSPQQEDLEQLRSEYDDARIVVLLTGVTQEVGTLHEYLGRLARQRLFQKVDLGGIEAVTTQDRTGSRFTAKLVLRAGYGQKRGPQAPLDSVAAKPVAKEAIP